MNRLNSFLALNQIKDDEGLRKKWQKESERKGKRKREGAGEKKKREKDKEENFFKLRFGQ